MKSLKNFSTKSQALSISEMSKTKGGNGITVDVQLDIVCLNPDGSVSTLFCDRRRKRLNA
jgi:lactam utilization protein B